MKNIPSIDEWLQAAKKDASASDVGMYLFHIGTVRKTEKAYVRGISDASREVLGMEISYDRDKVDEAIKKTYRMDGISYVKVWINEGRLQVGDDIMHVLIGGDIRPHVIEALQYLVDCIKHECVSEKEIFD